MTKVKFFCLLFAAALLLFSGCSQKNKAKAKNTSPAVAKAAAETKNAADAGSAKTPEKDGWYRNYDDAMELAKEQNLPLLIAFTKSDREPASKNLIDNVLLDKSFTKEVTKYYIPVIVDHKKEAKNAKGQTKSYEEMNADDLQNLRNKSVSELYNVLKTPALLGISPNHLVFAIFPVSGTPSVSSLTPFLKENAETGRKVMELTKKLQISDGYQKVTFIDELTELCPSEYYKQFYSLISQIPELDPENKSGIVGKYKVNLAYSSATKHMKRNKIEEAVKCFTDLLDDNTLTDDDKQDACYMAASIYHSRKTNPEGKKELLEKGLAYNPNGNRAEFFRNALKEFDGQTE